jgi:hypothetical protein
MANKTAVEWLIDELQSLGIYSSTLKEKCEQAKEMEKVQIMNAYIVGDVNGVESMIDNDFEIIGPVEYYNTTYKSEDDGKEL